MKSKTKFLVLAAVSVLLFSCTKTGDIPSGPSYGVVATLNGKSTVPSVNSGAVSGVYNSTTKMLTITVTHTIGAGKVTMGHIHSGSKGIEGSPIFTFAGTLDSGFTQTFTLDTPQSAILELGNLYVNLHSANYPGGEIRGQLTVNAGVVSAALVGAEEVQSTKTGNVTGNYESLTKGLTITTRHSLSTGTATMAHIHTGAVGVNGDVVFPFLLPIDDNNTQNFTLTAAQEASLLAGNLYVNVHSAAFPLGEIRGQLLATKK